MLISHRLLRAPPGQAMIAGTWRTDVNTASMSGRIVNRPQAGAPQRRQGGRHQLTRSLACEWAHGINVNSISPGYAERR
jgi:NAD(P)-dependent dehydrogenase (short-subunit alcohol dehydrogenase family)